VPTTDKEWDMTSYATLRTWAAVLRFTGFFGMTVATLGVVSTAIAAEGFWQTAGVILLGGPIVVLLASWPLALGQALGALAEIGDRVATEPARR
jgi:hypothetical protein